MKNINKFNVVWAIIICLLIALVLGSTWTPPEKINTILANQGYTQVNIQSLSLKPFTCSGNQYGYKFTGHNSLGKEVSGVACTSLFSSSFSMHFEG